MNRTVGLWSSVTVTGSVVLFALLMALRLDYGAYADSMVLSWAYLVMACGFGAEARGDCRSLSLAGVAFGVLYAGFATTVYFIQLTTVAQQNASADILNVITYQRLGSLMFNINLLAYAMMSISTFFIGLTIVGGTSAARWLKGLLLAHGVFAPVCVALPLLNVFGAMAKGSGDDIGLIVLFAWCIYFTPIGVLAIWHFRALHPAIRRPTILPRRSPELAT